MSESRLEKNSSANRAVMEQVTAADTKPGSCILTDEQWDMTAEILRLTRREKEVCRELFDGNTRIQIAEHLGIKPRTVRHYMEHIHQKLVVTNRVGVVLRIIQVRDRIAAMNKTAPVINTPQKAGVSQQVAEVGSNRP